MKSRCSLDRRYRIRPGVDAVTKREVVQGTEHPHGMVSEVVVDGLRSVDALLPGAGTRLA